MLNIVIPMAGRGSRFSAAGYDLPKPLIPVLGRPMIEVVSENLRPRRPHRFVYLVLQEHIDLHGLDELLRKMSPGAHVLPLAGVTDGAACTVLTASSRFDGDDPLMIANCDQWIDADIDDYLRSFDDSGRDGFIMTMKADHPKWSYVRLAASGDITEVVEKQVVSDEATVGIYNYRRGRDFAAAARRMIARQRRVNGEFYVAPAYNEMLEDGLSLGYFNVGTEHDGMHGLGVPEDLVAFERLMLGRRRTLGRAA